MTQDEYISERLTPIIKDLRKLVLEYAGGNPLEFALILTLAAWEATPPRFRDRSIETLTVDLMANFHQSLGDFK